MINPHTGLYTAIVSHRRSHEVPRLTKMVGEATWYVGEDEVAEYLAAGAARAVPTDGLVPARNQALDDAFALDAPCLQLSDDLRGVKQVVTLLNGKVYGKPVRFPKALALMMERAESYPNYKLIGVAPTANPLNFNAKRAVSTTAFVVGDMIVVKPTDLRFDPALRLKEDYDYTCQHIARYGGVVRCNEILAEFVHRTNAGGAVTYRTSDLEQAAIGYLRAKWGGVITKHPRKADEVVLRWPSA